MMQRIGIDLDGNFYGHYRATRPVSIHLQEVCIIFCGRVSQITFLLYLAFLNTTLIISSFVSPLP